MQPSSLHMQTFLPRMLVMKTEMEPVIPQELLYSYQKTLN